jgi:DNA-binding NarL/FixJ family response regulator
VLVSTVCERKGQVEEMMKMGANGYIQKPFSAEALVGKVNETFEIA